MPEVIYRTLKVELPANLQKKYDTLEKDLILEVLEEKLPIDNKSTNYIRCQQFANGILYKNKQKDLEFIHTEKIKMLKLLIESLQGKNILNVHWYKSDVVLLKKYFKNLVVFDSKSRKIYDDWNKGKIELLTGQPK